MAFTERSAPKILRTVLYVEDKSTNLELMVRLFERRSDLKLLTTTNGLSAIQIALEQAPDIIVMDMHLPGLNGTDTLKLMRQNEAIAHIPVVALSSDAYPHQIAQGLKAGFYRYMTKPFVVAELMDTLDAALLFAARQ